jgi:hypothetical protein
VSRKFVLSLVLLTWASADATASTAKNVALTNWSSLTTTGSYVLRSEIPPPGKGGQFGTSIAAWHDTATNVDWAIVGAPQENGASGAAYVFSHASGDMKWQKEAQLMADDASFGSVFGNSVAIDGDTVVVGSPLHVANFMTGAVYVFVRDPATGNWSQQGDGLMTGKNGFGTAVAVNGDMLAASSPDAEEVSTFVRGGSTWSSFFTVDAPAELLTASFGHSLAMDESRLLVGAPNDSAVATGQGSAVLYSLSRSSWDLQQIFRPQHDSTWPNQQFGSAVAMSDMIVVGAPWYPPMAGHEHVFIQDGGTFVEDVDLIDTRSTRSGAVVATQGDRFAEAAVDGDYGDYCDVVRRTSDGRYELESTVNGDTGTVFGSSIALLNDWLLVGAMGPDGADGDAFTFLNDRIFANGIE